MKATLHRAADDMAECRRLAEQLRLDAVGIARRGGAGRRVTWWIAPGSPAPPLDVASVLDGQADGWIVAPRGEDLLFARLPNGVRGAGRALARMLASLSGSGDGTASGSPSNDDLARERTRWAYAIHDGLTQVITAAVLDLESASRQKGLRPETAVAALDRAAGELRRALDEVRAVLSVVTPADHDEPEALDDLVHDLAERWQVPASWSIEGDLERVPRPVLDAASSVIREGMANAAKHSSTSDVAVRVHATRTGMEVRVEDRGRGFRPRDLGSAAGHLGLEMMRRRVAEVHGTLDIESEPGHGTSVVARLPVGQGETP